MIKLQFSEVTIKDGEFHTILVIDGAKENPIGAASIYINLEPGVEITEITPFFSSGVFLSNPKSLPNQARIVFYSLDPFKGEHFCGIRFKSTIDGSMFSDIDFTQLMDDNLNPKHPHGDLLDLEWLPSKAKLAKQVVIAPIVGDVDPFAELLKLRNNVQDAG